ncbi:MAG: sugar transferase [Rhodobacteraceae bacterium]|nr:sugar transferase [Paracoccaceae bacterium]
MLKRIFDITVSSLVLLMIWPIILLTAILTKLASPGPAFFVAKRVGQNGKMFNMYKIRSMHITQNTGTAITAPKDARIFPFGRFVRKAKLDELPQFWNVLVGEMSIVGPRPEDPLLALGPKTRKLYRIIIPAG